MKSDFMKMHLANVAPGIYFSLFGSIVLIFSVYSKVDLTYSNNNGNSSGGDGSDGQNHRVSRGIASEGSGAIVVSIAPEGLTEKQLSVAQKTSVMLELLMPFTDYDGNLSLLNREELQKQKKIVADEIENEFWKNELEKAEDPQEVYEVLRLLLDYIDSIEREPSE